MVKMNNRIKNLISLIKNAQELEDAPGAKSVTMPSQTIVSPTKSKSTSDELEDAPGVSSPKSETPSKSYKPTGSVQRPLSYSVPAVKEMQIAMLNFATAASAADMTSMTGDDQGQQYGNQSRDIPYAGGIDRQDPETHDTEYLGGTNPVGNFIVQNYLPKDIVSGKQYVNVDVVGDKNRRNMSMQPGNLRGIIDSIKRIGTPGSSQTEKSVDGIWKERTNNALHLIEKLVSAMLKFTQDMKIQVKGAENIQSFSKLIPNSYTDLKSQEDMKQRALALTPFIQEFTVFFQNLKPAVFNNRKIQPYIEQKTPFAQYQKVILPTGSARFTKLPGVQLSFDPKNVGVSLEDLSTMDKFKEYLGRFGVDAKDPANLKAKLDEIYEQINTMKQNQQNYINQTKAK
jgi:hypothetical protein